MCNKNISQPKFLFQIQQKIHDLHLGMCVQRRHRFIKQNHFRLTGHCPGDADSLQLSSRQFMRKTAGIRFIQSHQFQQLSGLFLAVQSLPVLSFPGSKSFPNQIFHPKSWICRCGIILQYHTQPFLQIFSAGTGTIYRSPIHLHFTLIRFQKSTDYFS